MHTQSLDGDTWTVRAVGDLSHVPDHLRGRVFPARVPGCVHLDLIRAGVLRHPNLGYSERDQEWIGRTDWRYECRFGVESEISECNSQTVWLYGVDTLAQVELNGEHLLRTSNAFHWWACPAERRVVAGENVLTVTISAPIPLVEREHTRLGCLPYNGDEIGWHPFNMLRKPACNFGWDWGPRVATSGIAGRVCLQACNGASRCIGAPTVSRQPDGSWLIEVSMWSPELPDLGDPAELRIWRVGSYSLGPRSVCERLSKQQIRCTLVVEEPDLWWPRGHGEPALYTLEFSTNYSPLASKEWRIGFRSVELDTSNDAGGSAFTLRVNGEPVFCRGANWIPDALFPTEVGPERLRERLQQAADANMNMIRVWGGGAYERDAFYAAADEMGLMIWQDFMFACALYPDWVLDNRAEYEHQRDRLALHPSVVLWCGGNECVQGYQHWGWRDRIAPGRLWGKQLWGGLLPRLMQKQNQAQPYWPNSPWSDAPGWPDAGATELDRRVLRDVQHPDHGDRHTWDLHFEDVRKIVPRFVSEFGRIAPACERTLHEAEVFAETPVSTAPPGWPREAPPWNDTTRAALEHRLRQTGGTKVAYDPVLPEHFRRPATDLRAWLWQTQTLQCRALTTHIEWLRANAPRCMGALIWQHNDCWACQSWSIIDSAGRPKPAWYAVRSAFEPRLLTIQPLGQSEFDLPSPRAGDLSLVLINDTAEPADAACRVRRIRFDGTLLAESTAHLTAAPRTNAAAPNLGALVGEPDDPTTELLIAESADHRALWFWDRDLRLHLPDQPLAAAYTHAANTLTLHLHARALAKDIIIAADLLDEHARADDNSFTLLPGESRKIRIEGVASDPNLPVTEFVRSASGPAAPA